MCPSVILQPPFALSHDGPSLTENTKDVFLHDDFATCFHHTRTLRLSERTLLFGPIWQKRTSAQERAGGSGKQSVGRATFRFGSGVCSSPAGGLLQRLSECAGRCFRVALQEEIVYEPLPENMYVQ